MTISPCINPAMALNNANIVLYEFVIGSIFLKYFAAVHSGICRQYPGQFYVHFAGILFMVIFNGIVGNLGNSDTFSNIWWSLLLLLAGTLSMS